MPLSSGCVSSTNKGLRSGAGAPSLCRVPTERDHRPLRPPDPSLHRVDRLCCRCSLPAGAEILSFDITNLCEDHFVKSGDNHFKPAGAEFTLEDWKTFGISGVCNHSFILSGQDYFKAAGRERRNDLCIDSFVQIVGGLYWVTALRNTWGEVKVYTKYRELKQAIFLIVGGFYSEVALRMI